jgi:hypothetical protein
LITFQRSDEEANWGRGGAKRQKWGTRASEEANWGTGGRKEAIWRDRAVGISVNFASLKS